MVRSVVVMGPSGNGKSTLARALAVRLGWTFIEGDDHHPPANVAKMRRGEPLDDADRIPFLDAVGQALRQADEAVAACSALKRAYRERLEHQAGAPLLFVLPNLPEPELRRRMESREGHFMPPGLLASQLATLELPGRGEHALLLDGTAPPDDLVEAIAAHLAAF